MNGFTDIETISIADRMRVEPTREVGVCSINRTVTDMFGNEIDRGTNVLYYRHVLEPSESESSDLHDIVNSNGTTLLVRVKSLSEIPNSVSDRSSESCWDCSDNTVTTVVHSSPFNEDRSSTEAMCSECLQNLQTVLREYFEDNRQKITVKLL